jgi:hypothetical protein
MIALVGLLLVGTRERKRAVTLPSQGASAASGKGPAAGSTVTDTAHGTVQTYRPSEKTETPPCYDTFLINAGSSHRPSLTERRRSENGAGRALPSADTETGAGARETPAGGVSGTAKQKSDTAAGGTGTKLSESASGNCPGDTLAPWVYPDPSGGLHRGTVAVTFQVNRPCTVAWRFEPDTVWHSWSGEPVVIERTATVAFKAADSCGRTMAERREYYEITNEQTAGLCPQDMELVKIGATRFCIDRYEWPNRKGALPQAYVSLYQAKDSCFAAGKRLCSTEEWSLACSGPYSWSYPYGQEYERYACVTHDTTVRPSGSKPECRAFFGAFDMAGNLLEWTSTPSRGNPQFYNVMGGFWQSGPRSGCFDIRYSYFPQNRHNPVGFRCCKDITPAGK